MMKQVIILKIPDYESSLIKTKIAQALDLHFPFERYFSKGDRILLKPNLLMAAAPDEAVTTHPVFIEAIGRIFRDRGCSVSIADSPGGFTALNDMVLIYNECGIKDLADKNGFNLLYSDKTEVREDMPFCDWSLDGYKIVNLPKLKTHGITVLSLAAKNLYGCISGLHKSYLHGLYPKTGEFSKIVVKINKQVKPQLHIIDGILAMEGNGPSKTGTPRKLNAVVIGDDPFAVDFAVAKLLSLPIEANPLLKEARRAGLFNETEIEIISDFGGFVYKDFKFPKPFFLNNIPDILLFPAQLLMRRRPVIKVKKCQICGKCIEVCPGKAITMKNKKVAINYKKCIMCMCCVEMCKFGAVSLEKNLAMKFISLLRGLIKRGG